MNIDILDGIKLKEEGRGYGGKGFECYSMS